MKKHLQRKQRDNKNLYIGLVLVLLCASILLTVISLGQNTLTQDKALAAITCDPITQKEIEPKPDATIAHEVQVRLDQNSNNFVKTFTTYRNSVGSNQTLLPQLKSIAQERKKLLVQAMEQNPNSAYQAIVQDARQINDPSVLPECKAKEQYLEGEVDIHHADYFPDSQFGAQATTAVSKDFYYLVTPEHQRIQLHPANGMKVALQAGQRVRVRGFRLDNDVVVNGQDTTSIQPLPTNSVKPLGIASSQGEQRLIIILFNFTDTNVAYDKASLGTSLPTLFNQYYSETSYGKTTFNATVVGPYQLNLSASCDTTTIRKAAVAAADGDVDFSKFNRLEIIGPMTCSWSGMASGSSSYSTNDGDVTLSNAHIKAKKTTPPMGTCLHEVGHNLGTKHSGFLDCGSSSICSQSIEYGDPYDVMGESGNKGQMSAFHKEKIGWFDNTYQIKTVDQSGAYTLTPYETNTPGIKVLKIPHGSSKYIYVEYRTTNGTDSFLQAPNIGAAFHITYTTTGGGGGDDTAVFDPVPPASVDSLALQQGQAFTDPDTGTIINVLQKTDTSLSVGVNIGGTGPVPSLGTPASPTAAPSNQPSPITGGGSVQVGVSISLHGIGNGGDNANPTAAGNNNPTHTSRQVSVIFFNNSGQQVTQATGTVALDGTSGGFTGTVPVTITPGAYLVKVKIDGFLSKSVPGIQNITAGQTVTLSHVALVAGDITNDDVINNLDYNAFLACFGSKQTSPTCTSGTLADLNDDGRVDGLDYNLMLRELSVQTGN